MINQIVQGKEKTREMRKNKKLYTKEKTHGKPLVL